MIEVKGCDIERVGIVAVEKRESPHKFLNPRCFKSLKDNSRLSMCDNFSSSKAWMASEIFAEILSRLN